METAENILNCDGCGLPASAVHVGERVRRLELSTRFRPVHIGILFLALAPAARPTDDFYGPPESGAFFDLFLEALGISSPGEKSASESEPSAAGVARLTEFQRRGYYLSYLSECPAPAGSEPTVSMIARLAPTLLRRIRFNYKPKVIAPLGSELLPLVDVLKAAQIGAALALDQGLPLPYPRTGDREWPKLFERAVAAAAPREYLSPGYDRIPLTATEGDLGAGGNS